MTGPTAHFSWNELTIRKGVAGADLDKLPPLARQNLTRLAEVLEVIRATVGKPLRVTSGYRHGDPLQHGQGQAADIQADGLSPMYLLRLVRRLHNAGLFPHPIRQVIAESLHGDEESVDEPMGEGSGQWLHVAILGDKGQKFDYAAKNMWQASWDPTDAARIYRSVS